jgi:hypothetical protein
MQADWLQPAGTLAGLVHDALPTVALWSAVRHADTNLREEG